MSIHIRFYTHIVSTILFVILVFMQFLGYWTADKFTQLLFFLCMVLSVFSLGMETEKKFKKRS